MTGFSRNQIRGDAHAFAMLHHGSLHQVADSQCGADLSRIGPAALECNGGMATEHIKPAIAGEQSNHVLGEAVAEIIGVGLLAQVGERQHGD